MFIINNDVSFNEEDGHLENRTSEVSVLMAASTRRLLTVLISNHGNPVERDCLLKTVWDDNGMRSSNSNLNQYISILRKQLLQVGLPYNAVITIPRVGFMFSPEIEVRRDILVTGMQLSRTGKTLRYFISSPLYYPVYTFCVLLLCLSVFLIFFRDQGPDLVTVSRLAGYPPQCDVYGLPSGGAVNKMEPVSFIAESCNKDATYFIFKHTPPPDDRLIVSCEKKSSESFSHCHNRRDVKG